MKQHKPVVFLGDALRMIRSFPDDARRAAGYQIGRLQDGSDPDDWKPLSTIATNVREIRIREDSGSFRVVYLAALADAVLVLRRRPGRLRLMKSRTRESDWAHI